MRIRHRTSSAKLVFTLIFGLSPFAGVESADLVLKNGNIYTVNEKQPKAEALASKQGTIIFVGSNSDAAKFENDVTRVVDLGGKTVVPGLTDSHYHLSEVGERELTLNLEETTSLDDFLAKVKTRVQQTKRGDWVTGRGWIETFWKPQVFPTRWDLDKISPENPVFCRALTVMARWRTARQFVGRKSIKTLRTLLEAR